MYAKRPIRLIVHTFMLALCLPLASCGDDPTLDPPAVRWGQDVCAECGMILSDDRYAAAVVAIHDGERHEYLYDDLGEMLAHPPRTEGAVKQWARDMRSRQWIDASTAHYIRSRRLHTPMGYGVVALNDLQDAEALRDETGGELLSLNDLSDTGRLGRDAARADQHRHAVPTGGRP